MGVGEKSAFKVKGRRLASKEKDFSRSCSSPLRIYKDSQWTGAKIVKKFRQVKLLIGIKEPQIDTLIPGSIYIVFSHTAKGPVIGTGPIHGFCLKQ